MIDPTVLPALAALSGVALTTIANILLSRIQRRHDRTGKLFETKLDLYARFASALETVQKTRAALEPAHAKADQLIVELEQASERLKTATNTLLQFRDANVDQDGSYPPNLPSEVIQHGQDIRAEFEAAKEARDKVKEQLAAASADASSRIEDVHTAGAEIGALAPRLILVAEESLAHEINIVMDRIIRGIEPNKDDFKRFNRVARRELGSRNPYLRGKINDLRLARIRKKLDQSSPRADVDPPS